MYLRQWCINFATMVAVRLANLNTESGGECPILYQIKATPSLLVCSQSVSPCNSEEASGMHFRSFHFGGDVRQNSGDCSVRAAQSVFTVTSFVSVLTVSKLSPNLQRRSFLGQVFRMTLEGSSGSWRNKAVTTVWKLMQRMRWGATDRFNVAQTS